MLRASSARCGSSPGRMRLREPGLPALPDRAPMRDGVRLVPADGRVAEDGRATRARKPMDRPFAVLTADRARARERGDMPQESNAVTEPRTRPRGGAMIRILLYGHEHELAPARTGEPFPRSGLMVASRHRQTFGFRPGRAARTQMDSAASPSSLHRLRPTVQPPPPAADASSDPDAPVRVEVEMPRDLYDRLTELRRRAALPLRHGDGTGGVRAPSLASGTSGAPPRFPVSSAESTHALEDAGHPSGMLVTAATRLLSDDGAFEPDARACSSTR